ncbi:uncharacterized protein LOC114912376 isoform X1 [Scleropages formosus]|uniref:uncharacterized protein LOC114912376 isoform X1 n=1 Tax=Scleropages formosus TaxID=113540 RepID=UPI0010FAB61F|nr:uncharacterized protein LOC114912376 isoform X1 [Scleropages formosus]XP_029114751.1 uncharacterized protein LOC114912376 isoform X1 [Scleropages formosus]
MTGYKMLPVTFFPLLIITCAHLSESTTLSRVAVDVKRSAILPCTHTVHKGLTEVTWRAGSEELVASYLQGNLTVGPGFESRVHLSTEGIEGGNLSLIISSVEYNDADVYSCSSDNVQLCDVRLQVFAPTVDPVPVGDRVKLPCYAPINRQTEDSQLNVRWEKEGKVVLHLHSGSVTLGSGFENRVSVSKEDIRKGDLSLVFNTTLFSDHGSYRCFYNKEKTAGDPEEIKLTFTAREDNLTVSEGDSITLPLHSTEPVRVQFSSAGDQSTGVSVCVVEGGLPRCETQYKHRVSIQNGSLHLQQASPSDRGVYRVMDHRTNDIISIFTVDLIEGTQFHFPWVTLAVVVGIVIVLMMLMRR